MVLPNSPFFKSEQQVEGNDNTVIAHNYGSVNVNNLIQQAEPMPEQALHQLPGGIGDFTGRIQELQTIKEFVAASSAEQSGLTILNISGMPGVGKSALAIHAAHKLQENYSDVQLYVNLRGAEGDQPLDPGEVLSQWLRSFGLKDAANLPNLDERISHYRSFLSNKRGLILLDNAANEQQVRVLLSGGSGCVVMVTSRRQLVAVAGAKLLELPIMPPGEAEALLTQLIHAQHQPVESENVTKIAKLCGYLPLALRIAGGTLNRRSWREQPLSKYAERLRDEQHRLSTLKLSHLSVRSSFHLSYGDLEPETQQLFGWLGLLEQSGEADDLGQFSLATQRAYRAVLPHAGTNPVLQS